MSIHTDNSRGRVRRWTPAQLVAQLSLPLCAAAVICLQACGRQEAPVETAKRDFTVMGTFASLTLPGCRTNKADEIAAAEEALLRRLEAALSAHRDDSEIGSISRLAGREPVPVSETTQRILAESMRYGRISGGAFDVTVGPLMSLWGFRGATVAAVPSGEAVRAACELVGYTHLVLTNGTAYLDKTGMRVDLGGIAKGYAVDLCCDDLAARGVTNALMNLGGNIRCLGTAGDVGKPWRIGVRNPFDRSSLIGILRLADGMATATSGNYEKFVDIQGEKFSHIMDPRTGRPVRGMAGVTVVTADATRADALSTTLFVLGVKDGAAVLTAPGDIGAIFVPDRQPMEIHLVGRIAEIFEPEPQFRDRVIAGPGDARSGEEEGRTRQGEATR